MNPISGKIEKFLTEMHVLAPHIAKEQYETHQKNIGKLLSKIQTATKNHQPKNQIHYGHVGDLEHVHGKLKEIHDFLTSSSSSRKVTRTSRY